MGVERITALVCRINGRPLNLRGLIAYLNNHIFPPLLTEEQEAAYIRDFQTGGMEARNALIEHNLRLVAHICKKFESSGVDKEDLISIGTIGLIKGINTFSPDRGVRLATYAARCIENAILSQRRLYGLRMENMYRLPKNGACLPLFTTRLLDFAV